MENKNVLSAQIIIDTKEARGNIKELTKAADECMVALTKLEQVMGKFTNRGELKDIQVGIVFDGRAESIIRQANELGEIRRKF